MAWWMAIPMAVQAASAVSQTVGGILGGNQLRKETDEQIRRMKLEHERTLSSTLAAGLGSGVEVGSESLQKYISDMSAEMLRQRQWVMRAGERAATSASLSAVFQGVGGLANSFNQFAAANNYWKSPSPKQ